MCKVARFGYLGVLMVALGTSVGVQASPILSITPSATTVEWGTPISVELSGSGLGTLSGYQAQLKLCDGICVGSDNCIHPGDFFRQARTLTRQAPVPMLISLSQNASKCETHDSATLATFDLLTEPQCRLGYYNISTVGSILQDANGRNIGDVQHAQTTIEVVAPLMTLSSYVISFPTIEAGGLELGQTVVKNIGNQVTTLNGCVSDVGTLLQDNEPFAGNSVFSLECATSTFDLIGAGWATRTLHVNFNPQKAGTYVGYMDIVSDDGIGGPLAEGSTMRVLLIGTASPAPEPTTLAVLGLGTIAVIRRRR